MKGKVLITSILLILVLATVLPACGSSTPTTTAAPTTTTAAPTTTTAAPTTTTAKPTTTTTAPASTTPAKTIKLKIASYGGSTYNQRLAMEYAMDLIAKKSGGVIVWDYYPGGALFDLNAAFPGIRNGMADIGITTFGNIDKSLVGPLFNCNAPPMSFDPEKFNTQFRSSGYYDTGNTILNKVGIQWLAQPRVGWNAILSQKAVNVLADWKGLLVRSTGAMVEPFKALGAAPVVMSLADVYEGMSRGTVNGAMASASNIIDNKLWEVASYLIDAHLYSGSLDHIMNLKTLQSLDPATQKIITDAFWDAQQWEWKQCRDTWNPADTKTMASHMMKTISITGAELQLWTDTARKPFLDQLKKDFPDQYDTFVKYVQSLT